MLYPSSLPCDQHLTLHLLRLLGSLYSFWTFSSQSNVSYSKISGGLWLRNGKKTAWLIPSSTTDVPSEVGQIAQSLVNSRSTECYPVEFLCAWPLKPLPTPTAVGQGHSYHLSLTSWKLEAQYQALCSEMLAQHWAQGAPGALTEERAEEQRPSLRQGQQKSFLPHARKMIRICQRGKKIDIIVSNCKITQVDSWAHAMSFWQSDSTSPFEPLKMKAEF